MPIDDIDYLKQNSIKQNYTFLIDSKDRKYNTWPTPSEYTIEIDPPFINVVGFQLLESTIPKTMYNVDIYNNKLSFFIYNSNIIDITQVHPSNYIGADGSRTIDVGDYTIQTLISAFNGYINNDKTQSKLLEMHVNNDPEQPIARIFTESLSTPPDSKNIIKFTCPYPFVFDMSFSTIAETIGFDMYPQISTEVAKLPLQQRYTAINAQTAVTDTDGITSFVPVNNPKLYSSVNLDPTISLGEPYIVFQGPPGNIYNTSLTPTSNITTQETTYYYVAQSFTVQTAAYLTQVGAALNIPNALGAINPGNEYVSWALYSSSNNAPYNIINTSNSNLITGNYDIATSNTIVIASINGGYSFTTQTFQIQLQPANYWIVMTSLSPSLSLYTNEVQYYSPYNPLLYLSTTSSNPVISNLSLSWATQDQPALGIYNQASIQVILKDTYHFLIAPGIYTLIGERYVVVRCSQIEEHAFRSLSYTKHNLGLGKVNLASVGYNQTTADFKSVDVREFHPIGRLSRLSFRFETIAGNLYDFKGINHTLTCVIYYYEPIAKKQFQQSILNPNYNGDFLAYYNTTIEPEEDSDDDNPVQYNYHTIENRHMPDSIERINEEALYRFNFDNEE